MAMRRCPRNMPKGRVTHVVSDLTADRGVWKAIVDSMRPVVSPATGATGMLEERMLAARRLVRVVRLNFARVSEAEASRTQASRRQCDSS